MSKITDALMKGLELTPEQREQAVAYAGNISHSAATPAQTKGDDLVTVGYLFRLRYGPDHWSQQLMYSQTLPKEGDYKEVTPLVSQSEAASRIQSLTASNEALERERDELVAANNAIEADSGLTSDGNLWRFWAKKASDFGDKFSAIYKDLQAAQAEIATLREALGPFAEQMELIHDSDSDSHTPDWSPFIPVRTYRAARAALSTPQEPK